MQYILIQNKNHSIDAGKIFISIDAGKENPTLMIKTISKIGIEGNFLDLK